jgi:inhibitor of KinA sporulation pathway (predicted exonuclease)
VRRSLIPRNPPLPTRTRARAGLTRLQQCQLHEIIEFPCVLLDSSLIEIAAFREFVRPVEGVTAPGGSRVISDFCTRLTGITQQDVAAAAPLAEVLARFEAWLAARGMDDAVATGRAVLVTHGEWDLGDQLRVECARKGLPVPPPLRGSFVDIKVPFSETVGGGTSITQMMAALGLRPAGRAHSGIDDARNISQVPPT